MMQSDYESYNKNIEFFWKQPAKQLHNLICFRETLQEMQQIEFLEIQIRGYSSPLFSDKYNLTFQNVE